MIIILLNLSIINNETERKLEKSISYFNFNNKNNQQTYVIFSKFNLNDLEYINIADFEFRNNKQSKLDKYYTDICDILKKSTNDSQLYINGEEKIKEIKKKKLLVLRVVIFD